MIHHNMSKSGKVQSIEAEKKMEISCSMAMRNDLAEKKIDHQLKTSAALKKNVYRTTKENNLRTLSLNSLLSKRGKFLLTPPLPSSLASFLPGQKCFYSKVFLAEC